MNTITQQEKEKAKELIEKFNDYAASVADEVIKSWQEDGNQRLDISIIEWWQRVKQLIINEPGN